MRAWVPSASPLDCALPDAGGSNRRASSPALGFRPVSFASGSLHRATSRLGRADPMPPLPNAGLVMKPRSHRSFRASSRQARHCPPPTNHTGRITKAIPRPSNGGLKPAASCASSQAHEPHHATRNGVAPLDTLGSHHAYCSSLAWRSAPTQRPMRVVHKTTAPTSATVFRKLHTVATVRHPQPPSLPLAPSVSSPSF